MTQTDSVKVTVNQMNIINAIKAGQALQNFDGRALAKLKSRGIVKKNGAALTKAGEQATFTLKGGTALEAL